MDKLLIGDVHGNLSGVKSILEQADYTPEKYHLIFVGDYVDGFPGDKFDAKGLIDFLTTLENTIFVMGNHDKWMLDWVEEYNMYPRNIWYNQGGEETLESYSIGYEKYSDVRDKIPKSHIDFLKNLAMFYVDDQVVIVHGGFNNHFDMRTVMDGEGCLHRDVMWDRLFYQRDDGHLLLESYKEIFGDRVFICGHTPHESAPTINENPKRICIDGGSNGGGILTGIILNKDGEVETVLKEK